MKARERRSDIESELESKDPTEVGDMIFSEEEESREVVVTLVERRNPMTMSAGDEQDAERCTEVPMPRKHVASADAVGEAGTVTVPFGGVASFVPTCCGRDRASQVVRGAG